MNKWLLLGAAIMLNAAANILIKAGVRQLGSLEWGLSSAIRAVTNVWLLLGVVCFALALAAYSLALTRFALSAAYPLMTGFGFAIVALASYVWFKEDLSWLRLTGMAVILAGIAMVAYDAK